MNDSGESRTKMPRCQDPKNKGKRKPRIQERVQKNTKFQRVPDFSGTL